MTADEFRKVSRPRNQKKEESLQVMVARYMRTVHPDIIFRSDIAAGLKLTIHQAAKAKSMQHSSKYPDMFICKVNHLYAGLFLELKKDRRGVYLRNGVLSQDKHIRGQRLVHEKLISAGYFATFACGYDEAIKIIEEYLSIP